MPFKEYCERAYAPTPAAERYWHTVPEEGYVLGMGEPFSCRLEFDRSRFANPYGIEVSDILLTAFVRWFRSAVGSDPVLRMEGHGRGPDVERTVGWFTCVYPLQFSSGDDIIADLFGVRGLRRSVPEGGVGFGRLHPDAVLPSVTFNYLGE